MNTGMPVESPVRGDVHAGFGGRVGKTDRPRGRHRVPARPYVFRFNRRRTPMAAFQTLLGLGARHQPTTYRQINDGALVPAAEQTG
jgi:hypothetical protein